MTAHIRFSPLEETCLAVIGERWSTIRELQEQLFPQHAPALVRGAVNYLRRKELVQELERRHGTPLYEQTELGRLVLREYRYSVGERLYVA